MTLKFKITPTEFIAGPFDASNRYLRQGASGARFPVPKNATISLVAATTGTSQTFYWATLRFSVNGVVRQRTHLDDDQAVSVSAGSYNSTVALVKT